jgi:uncharacterized cupredoxin-like copper-binding protein
MHGKKHFVDRQQTGRHFAELREVPAFIETGGVKVTDLRTRRGTATDTAGTARRPPSPLSANLLAAVILAVLAVMLLLACGNRGYDPAPTGSTKVTMIDYRFSPSTLQAKAGTVTFFLINTGTQSHDMVVTDGQGKVVGRSEIVQRGNSGTLTLGNLTAGDYDVSCSIPGHSANGMVSKLKVA